MTTEADAQATWEQLRDTNAHERQLIYKLGLQVHELLHPPVTVPPTEPEPPIVVPPDAEYGCDESKLTQTIDIEWGNKQIEALMLNGGLLENARIDGDNGHGYCLSTLKNDAKTRATIRNCLLVPNQASSKASASRRYGVEIQDERVTYRQAGPCTNENAEGHVYENPYRQWVMRYCLAYEMPGNIQGTYRPSEGAGPCSYVEMILKIVNGHAPLANGKKSAMVGPLVALYNLAADCEANIAMIVRQDKWAQFGPMVTCVPGLAAGEVYAGQEGAKVAWWKPGDQTHAALNLSVDFEGKRPTASELLKVNGCRKIVAHGKVQLTDSASPLRIMIDPPLHYGAPAQEVYLDLDVRGPSGESVACPIERNGVVVAHTTDGVYAAGAPIGTH